MVFSLTICVVCEKAVWLKSALRTARFDCPPLKRVGAILLVKFISKNALITSNTQNEFYFFASKSETHINTDLTNISRDRVVKYKEYQVTFSGAEATINMANDGILAVRVLDVTHNRVSETGYTIQFIPSPQVASGNPYVITVVRQRWNSGTPVGVTTSETITLRVNYY